MKKKLLITLLLFTIVKVALCQYDSYDRGGSAAYDDDEEKMTLADVGGSLLMGGVLAVAGFLIMQIKATNTFGKILLGIGAIVGGGAVVIYLLQVIGMILSAAFSLAYKLAIIVGVVLLAGWIIKGIYNWISGNSK
jgi:hypothetical protein